jgi:hypothetical protein
MQSVISDAPHVATPITPMDPARRPRAWAILALATVAVTGGLLSSQPSEPDRSLQTAAAELTLYDDDEGSALFNLTNLAPGDVASRCVRVSYGGAGLAPLTLRGATAGSGLAEHLALTVEEGSGGGFASCDGFEGGVIFRGTLGEFAQTHHDYASGLPASLGKDGPQTGTFRFTIALLDTNAAQGRTASARFVWEAQADAPAGKPQPAPGSARPTPDIGETPPQGSAGGSPRTGGPPSARARRHPGSGAGESPGRPDRAGEGEPGSSSSSGNALEAALAILQRAAFPAFLLLVVLLFLRLQERIDRKDPNLALAPIGDEPDLAFVPRDRGGIAR